MLVLVYRKCSTCLKALKWLEDNQIHFEERSIVEQNPSYEELKKWHVKSGQPLKKFFNTSGLLYKELNLKETGEKLGLVATGGLSQKILPFMRNKFIYDETLTLSGVVYLYRKNLQKINFV